MCYTLNVFTTVKFVKFLSFSHSFTHLFNVGQQRNTFMAKDEHSVYSSILFFPNWVSQCFPQEKRPEYGLLGVLLRFIPNPIPFHSFFTPPIHLYFLKYMKVKADGRNGMEWHVVTNETNIERSTCNSKLSRWNYPISVFQTIYVENSICKLQCWLESHWATGQRKMTTSCQPIPMR